MKEVDPPYNPDDVPPTYPGSGPPGDGLTEGGRYGSHRGIPGSVPIANGGLSGDGDFNSTCRCVAAIRKNRLRILNFPLFIYIILHF